MRFENILRWIVLLIALVTVYFAASKIAYGEDKFEKDYNTEMLKLAGQYYCLACHNVEKKMVGPAWKDVAKRGDSIEVLTKSIIHGSQGKWGSMPMPPNRITEMEAQELAIWIRSLK